MASTKLLTFFFPASLLLLSISPFGSSENVTVSVYYETLCPYCADFIVNHLVKLFQKGLNSIVNLRMIPWGNSMMQPDGTFVCQVTFLCIFFLILHPFHCFGFSKQKKHFCYFCITTFLQVQALFRIKCIFFWCKKLFIKDKY